ncbi:MAG: hypothetical protein GC166_10910 [Alphaproteobacteria bacterium]|nr:hypothetical protein [Alphaproteobacteria bacterium]
MARWNGALAGLAWGLVGLTALAVPAVAGIAQDFAPLMGVWTGAVQLNGGRIYPVEVAITQSSYGKAAGAVAWGKLQDCTNKLLLWGETDQTFVLKVTQDRDGFCRRLHDGSAELTALPDGKLGLVLRTADGRSYAAPARLKRAP